MKKSIPISIAVLAILTSTPIYAQQTAPGLEPDQGFMTDRLLPEDIDRGAGLDRDIDRDEDAEGDRDVIRRDTPDLKDEGPA